MEKSMFDAEMMKKFASYERVRSQGRFNMFDARARQLTGLDQRDYLFMIDNYPLMRKQYLDELQVERRSQLPLFPELS